LIGARRSFQAPVQALDIAVAIGEDSRRKALLHLLVGTI